MLRSRSCKNCASGDGKCNNPCVFSTMKRLDYNAVRNHLGRDMYKRHLEYVENTRIDKKDTVRKALIGASKWWTKDPFEGTYGEIKRRQREEKKVSRILLQMSKGISGTTNSAAQNYARAEKLASKLAPHHPARVAVAVAHSRHFGRLLDYQRAVSIASKAATAIFKDGKWTDKSTELYEMLSSMAESWRVAAAASGVNLEDDNLGDI